MDQVSEWSIPYREAEISEATAELGTPISENAARFAIRQQRIAFVKIGRARFTSHAALIDYIESCRVEPKHQEAQAV